MEIDIKQKLAVSRRPKPKDVADVNSQNNSSRNPNQQLLRRIMNEMGLVEKQARQPAKTKQQSQEALPGQPSTFYESGSGAPRHHQSSVAINNNSIINQNPKQQPAETKLMEQLRRRQAAIDKQYKKSVVNKIYIFPRTEEKIEDLVSVSSHSSIQQMDEVTSYILREQNRSKMVHQYMLDQDEQQQNNKKSRPKTPYQHPERHYPIQKHQSSITKSSSIDNQKIAKYHCRLSSRANNNSSVPLLLLHRQQMLSQRTIANSSSTSKVDVISGAEDQASRRDKPTDYYSSLLNRNDGGKRQHHPPTHERYISQKQKSRDTRDVQIGSNPTTGTQRRKPGGATSSTSLSQNNMHSSYLSANKQNIKDSSKNLEGSNNHLQHLQNKPSEKNVNNLASKGTLTKNVYQKLLNSLEQVSKPCNNVTNTSINKQSNLSNRDSGNSRYPLNPAGQYQRQHYKEGSSALTLLAQNQSIDKDRSKTGQRSQKGIESVQQQIEQFKDKYQQPLQYQQSRQNSQTSVLKSQN